MGQWYAGMYSSMSTDDVPATPGSPRAPPWSPTVLPRGRRFAKICLQIVEMGLPISFIEVSQCVEILKPHFEYTSQIQPRHSEGRFCPLIENSETLTS